MIWYKFCLICVEFKLWMSIWIIAAISCGFKRIQQDYLHIESPLLFAGLIFKSRHVQRYEMDQLSKHNLRATIFNWCNSPSWSLYFLVWRQVLVVCSPLSFTFTSSKFPFLLFLTPSVEIAVRATSAVVGAVCQDVRAKQLHRRQGFVLIRRSPGLLSENIEFLLSRTF